MVEAFVDTVPVSVYIFNMLYWTLPTLLFHFGVWLHYPVEVLLFIHIVIMLIIPKLIVHQFKDSPLFRLHWRINTWMIRGSGSGSDEKVNRFEDIGSFFGVVVGIVFWGLIIFLYWLVDQVILWDLHHHIMRTPIPKNNVLEVISAIYLVLITPYIEEWFWRRYNYHIFYKTELDYWLNSIFWSGIFVVLARDCKISTFALVMVFITFVIFGRIQIAITAKYHAFACYMAHVGVNCGIITCYFLEKYQHFNHEA